MVDDTSTFIGQTLTKTSDKTDDPHISFGPSPKQVNARQATHLNPLVAAIPQYWTHPCQVSEQANHPAAFSAVLRKPTRVRKTCVTVTSASLDIA